MSEHTVTIGPNRVTNGEQILAAIGRLMKARGCRVLFGTPKQVREGFALCLAGSPGPSLNDIRPYLKDGAK